LENVVLPIPDPSLVLLVGPAGSGKSTFAARHFRPTEVLSSDFLRGLVADDEADQAASRDAFEVLHLLAGKRLRRGLLTVLDATHTRAEARKPLLKLAQHHDLWAAAVVFALPLDVCAARNRMRSGRTVPAAVVAEQWERLRGSLPTLQKDERFHAVHVLTTPEEVDAVRIERGPLPPDRRGECGPFDIIGDVHGCLDELLALLGRLGYDVAERPEADGGGGFRVNPPPGRKVIFVGDLVDRGPNVAGALRLAMGMVEAGTALCVAGNHDDKLRRKLEGRDVRVGHGLAESLAQLGREPPAFAERVRTFLESLVTHYVLDGGRLVVAHAGLPAELQGRVGSRLRSFSLFGDTTGETDEFGLPVRRNWAADYRGPAAVVYGHTPVPEAVWQNRTINLDTGCVFGGRLTALRYPEMELASVPAARTYGEPARPFLPPPSPV
jgi:polynucleotide kinase-phosphatase